jgi:hypothetical protein
MGLETIASVTGRASRVPSLADGTADPVLAFKSKNGAGACRPPKSHREK